MFDKAKKAIKAYFRNDTVPVRQGIFRIRNGRFRYVSENVGRSLNDEEAKLVNWGYCFTDDYYPDGRYKPHLIHNEDSDLMELIKAID